ncbi:siphovirus Gp157 family protein [Erwinia sp. HDF1-3R]|uniref:siphovirus Gp157 family protein n=1 Tax=Erwinia sp. HDF1-3R TaxID=3141543 RepID=UPI0031F4843D
MSKLYEIANSYVKLTESDMTPEMIADTLEGIEGEFSDKICQLLAICKNESVYVDALRNEAKSLTERAATAENRITSIKTYIAQTLQHAGLKKITAGLHQVSVRAPTKSVDITDAGALPPNLVEYETTIKPDKLGIKKLLDAGQDVPGAKIKVGKLSLIIK